MVEHIALILSEAGIPRIPPGLFTYMLTDDADRYTAAALAQGLG